MHNLERVLLGLVIVTIIFVLWLFSNAISTSGDCPANTSPSTTTSH